MEPMLAKIGGKKELEGEFLFEPKIDGIRALCYVNKGIKLVSRRGKTITDRYPEFQFRQNIDADECLLDGEIAIYDLKGNPDFNLLQQREQTRNKLQILHLSEKRPANYIAFDILSINGEDLTDKPLHYRKKELEKTIREGNGIQKMPYTNNGKMLWEAIEKRNLEGVIAKNPKSRYYPGKRTHDWIKIKLLNTIDCVIIGYTSTRRIISSIALGIYENKKITYIGKVGTGFTESFLESLHKKLKPAQKTIVDYADKTIIWVEPELVCEVTYLEFTRDRIMRSPSFLRLRDDKKTTDCTIEQIR